MAETRTVKQVCKCENCGNEAEMVVTCSLEEVDTETPSADKPAAAPAKVKGSGVCTSCGNEADMWVDI